MTAFDEQTKRNGFATVNISDSHSLLVNVLDTFAYSSVYKAENANVIAYEKATLVLLRICIWLMLNSEMRNVSAISIRR